MSRWVDVLISKIGIDKSLTNVLIDYSLEKTDDDKSWDISNDLKALEELYETEIFQPGLPRDEGTLRSMLENSWGCIQIGLYEDKPDKKGLHL